MSLVDNLSSSGIFKHLSNDNRADGHIDKPRVAIRNGDEIFFAHDSSVRYCNLSKGPQYQVLETNAIDFKVEGLILNDSGSLLAVYNSHKLAVISLSSSDFNISKSDHIQTKSFVVANNIYGPNLQIVEALWNGISRFDSTLVILSADGVVRTFDLRVSVANPDSIYELSSFNKNKIGLNTNSVELPVSIAFGSKTDLSGALTLYVLNKESDVFAIYPFMPKQIAVPRSAIEDLFNETLLLSNNSKSSNTNAYSDQLRFVTYLWNQLPISPKEVRDAAELCVLDNNICDDYYIQGPFAIQPFPNVFYDDFGVNITSAQFGSSDVLLISSHKNGLLAALPDIDLPMKWKSTQNFEDYLVLDERENETATLTVLEHIALGTSSPSYIGPQYSQSNVLVESSQKLFTLDFTRWSEFFQESISDDDSSEIQKEIDSSVGTKVQLLLQLRNNESVEGIFILQKETDKKSSILVTTQRLEAFESVEASPDGNTDSIIERPDVRYQTLLDSPYTEISKLAASTSNIRINSQSSHATEFVADDFFLRELNNASTQTLEHVVQFHKLGLSLSTRLIKQKEEFERQLRKSFDSMQVAKTVVERSEGNKKAIANALTRQQRIDERFSKLSKDLKGTVDLPLSTREKVWFKELKETTLFFNKAAKQNNALKQQIAFIKAGLQTRASSQYTDSLTDNQNWDELNNIIDEGSKLLKRTTQELKNNTDQFEIHLKGSRF